MIKDTVSSKRGKNRLRKHSDKHITNTLALLGKLLDIAEESGNKEDIYRAYQAHIELIPYIKPKLQAIAPAEMDNEGNLTPYIAGRIAELVAETRKALPQEEDNGNSSLKVEQM